MCSNFQASFQREHHSEPQHILYQVNSSEAEELRTKVQLFLTLCAERCQQLEIGRL